MRKVLLYGCSKNNGGIERYIRNLLEKTQKDFEYAIMIDFDGPTPIDDVIAKYNIRVIRITNRRRNYRRYLADLKRAFKEQFDVAYLNLINYSPFEIIAKSKKQKHTKVIIHCHTAGVINGSIKTIMLNKLGRSIARGNNITRVACGTDAGKYMFGKRKFYVINNGIDTDEFKYNDKDRKSVRKEFRVKEDECLIGNIASFLPIKNQQYLIKLFAECEPEKNKLKLMLVGEGQEKEKCEELAKKNGISRNVIFTGRRDDVNRIYSALDMFAMPSIVEGISFAILEAQVNGLRCLASDGIDRDCDITGNVKFINLQDKLEWLNNITHRINRDKTAEHKIPKGYRLDNSVREIRNIMRRPR